MLNLESDSLEELVGVLHYLADEIEAEGRDSRRITYRGTSSTYEARLRTDPEQDCERYREQLGKWYRDQDLSSAPRAPYDSVG
jgi:hypothetical protein